MTVSDDSLRLAEALIFASATPVTLRALTALLPEEDEAEAVVAGLKELYSGRGVELVEVAGGLQFRTAPDLAPRLTRVIEVPRRLPRVAMETLAIIAYRQPVTRGEIEEVRGTALSQNTIDALLEAELIGPCGRKESPGRPTLWATTPGFLAKFGLNSLRDLPRREDLMNDTALMEAAAPMQASDDAMPANEAQAEERQAEEPQLEVPQLEVPAAEERQLEEPAVDAPPVEEPRHGAAEAQGD
jgi:segregation and condensation protein B